MTTLPTATAPSAAKHPAASHVVLTIFQSLRPLPQDSLRFYWGGYAAECLSIMAIPRNQPSRGRCFVRDNGSCFGMRASEGLFGCLSSRMADFWRKESQPKVLTDNLWMETGSPWRAVRRIHMLRLAGVVPITMRWPFECCTTVRRKIERRHSGRSWRPASISTECIRGMD